jgi:DNA (cytosine-5)-methyltransferase 1
VNKLLDLFCCAGGCSEGYRRAGFTPYGIDIKHQPHYPFPFLQMDALEAMDILLKGGSLTFSNGETLSLNDFAAFHASPPCQHASTIAKQNRVMRPGKYNHPNMIPDIRPRLVQTGKPYVIENVKTSSLINPGKLTGSWFGLDVKRDRYFECSFPMFDTPLCGWQTPRFRSLDQRRKGKLSAVVGVHGHIKYHGEGEIRAKAMGINWMVDSELVQAIPPAYTEYIGKYLLKAIIES